MKRISLTRVWYPCSKKFKNLKTLGPAFMAEERPAVKRRSHGSESKLAKRLLKLDEQIRETEESLQQYQQLLPEPEGFLETTDAGEALWKTSQAQLKNSVPMSVACRRYDLSLPYGPYKISFTGNGRNILIGGNRGHLASFDAKTGHLKSELEVPEERIFDCCWLWGNSAYAVAQKRCVAIYDATGLELHSLESHSQPLALQFLPYHFLLCSVGASGMLRYQDVSTGERVAELRSRLGSCSVMAQNPQNAIVHLGHANGCVSFWSPTTDTPLVRIKCHRGPLGAVAIDPTGRYMATGGLEGCVKIWDLANYACIERFRTARSVSSLSVSQKGLLAVGSGSKVSIWKNVFGSGSEEKSLYLEHRIDGQVSGVSFCPFEDILGVGGSGGFSSLIVPGSGEPNFDAFEQNPFATKRQRQESEVRSLLDKIQPEMISLDNSFLRKTE